MSERGLANLTDVTLADKDINSILTDKVNRALQGKVVIDVTLADQATNSIQADNANMAIQGNVAMKVTQSSGQLWNQCKRRHPLTKF